MAPRKVRLVLGLIRGLPATQAEERLRFVQKDAALPVLKLLKSAMANAEHNFKLDAGKLFVKTATADGGPVLKRSRPRAMGRGVIIRKRTTHINLVLSDEAPVAKASKKKIAPKTAVKKTAKTKTVKAAKSQTTEQGANA